MKCFVDNTECLVEQGKYCSVICSYNKNRILKYIKKNLNNNVISAIVAGGRDFKPAFIHEEWLRKKFKDLKVDVLICGMAKGADMFGYSIAKKVGILIKEYPADWNTFGKSAGYIRNQEMAEVANILILFPGGKGTTHMKNIAKRKNLIIIEYEEKK